MAASAGDESDRILFRAAGVAAVGFLVLGIPAQFLHPLPKEGVATSFLEEITKASAYWTHIHLLTVATACLTLVLYLALYRWVSGPAAKALGALGLAFGVVGVAFVFSWIAIDGVAIVHIAEDWETASGADQETAFRVANAVEDIILAYFSLAWVIWIGLPTALFGAAVAFSEPGRAWIGRIGLVGGTSALVVGLVQVYTGRDFVVTDILIPITAFAAGLWLVAMGVRLWRAAGTTEPLGRPAPAPPRAQ